MGPVKDRQNCLVDRSTNVHKLCDTTISKSPVQKCITITKWKKMANCTSICEDKRRVMNNMQNVMITEIKTAIYGMKTEFYEETKVKTTKRKSEFSFCYIFEIRLQHSFRQITKSISRRMLNACHFSMPRLEKQWLGITRICSSLKQFSSLQSNSWVTRVRKLQKAFEKKN